MRSEASFRSYGVVVEKHKMWPTWLSHDGMNAAQHTQKRPLLSGTQSSSLCTLPLTKIVPPLCSILPPLSYLARGSFGGLFTALYQRFCNVGRRLRDFPVSQSTWNWLWNLFSTTFSFGARAEAAVGILCAFFLELPQAIRFWLDFGKNGKVWALKRDKMTHTALMYTERPFGQFFNLREKLEYVAFWTASSS